MLGSALEQVERQIRWLPIEHAFVFATDGTLLLTATNDSPDSVAFSLEQIPQLRDAVLTHNHPGGRSLSEDDLLLAMDADLAQIRAVTATHRYWITRPLQGWTPQLKIRVRTALAAEQALLIGRVRRDISAGRISPEAVDLNFHHLLWTALAGRGVVRYASEQWDDSPGG